MGKDLAKQLRASLCSNKLEAQVVERLNAQQELIGRLKSVMLDVQLTLERGDLSCELVAASKLRVALLPDNAESNGPQGPTRTPVVGQI